MDYAAQGNVGQTTILRSTPPSPAAAPTQSAIASHALTLANACEMAANNMDRLKRFKARLCGISELGAGSTGKDPNPQPDGLLPRLVGLDGDLEQMLFQTAKLLDDLGAIA